ncbi:MAG TPA: hypothetical protein VGF99_12775 [Myxococcota bacterium]
MRGRAVRRARTTPACVAITTTPSLTTTTTTTITTTTTPSTTDMDDALHNRWRTV